DPGPRTGTEPRTGPEPEPSDRPGGTRLNPALRPVRLPAPEASAAPVPDGPWEQGRPAVGPWR
ncbi:hypothetical protein KDA82_23405, partial [Streptomyces daliensis]|nr:hypothetical protein [Streptomyces daliensis]